MQHIKCNLNVSIFCTLTSLAQSHEIHYEIFRHLKSYLITVISWEILQAKIKISPRFYSFLKQWGVSKNVCKMPLEFYHNGKIVWFKFERILVCAMVKQCRICADGKQMKILWKYSLFDYQTNDVLFTIFSLLDKRSIEVNKKANFWHLTMKIKQIQILFDHQFYTTSWQSGNAYGNK